MSVVWWMFVTAAGFAVDHGLFFFHLESIGDGAASCYVVVWKQGRTLRRERFLGETRQCCIAVIFISLFYCSNIERCWKSSFLCGLFARAFMGYWNDTQLH